VPDFIVRLKGELLRHIILETKGYELIGNICEVSAKLAAKSD
jgi:hypothetical protein